MKTSHWYSEVAAECEISQGDLIMDCPVLEWAGVNSQEPRSNLKERCEAIAVDLVVMTQACDLSQKKVDNLIACAHFPLSKFKDSWESAMTAKGQSPSAKAWKRYCDDVCDGYVWHLSMLNSREEGDLQLERRVVDFHRVYSLPVEFLQALLLERNQQRLILLPPYREHLSQAFSRFFMRVGLPVNIAKNWDI